MRSCDTTSGRRVPALPAVVLVTLIEVLLPCRGVPAFAAVGDKVPEAPAAPAVAWQASVEVASAFLLSAETSAAVGRTGGGVAAKAGVGLGRLIGWSSPLMVALQLTGGWLGFPSGRGGSGAVGAGYVGGGIRCTPLHLVGRLEPYVDGDVASVWTGGLRRLMLETSLGLTVMLESWRVGVFGKYAQIVSQGAANSDARALWVGVSGGWTNQAEEAPAPEPPAEDPHAAEKLTTGETREAAGASLMSDPAPVASPVAATVSVPPGAVAGGSELPQTQELSQSESRSDAIDRASPDAPPAAPVEAEPARLAAPPGVAVAEVLEVPITEGWLSAPATYSQLHEALLDLLLTSQATEVALPVRIYFPSEATELTVEDNQTLALVARLLALHPQIRLQLEGHTDDMGSTEVNERLSLERAWAVMAALVARGIDPRRLEPRGRGSVRPLIPAQSPAARRVNRRVELTIVAPHEPTDSEPSRRSP